MSGNPLKGFLISSGISTEQVAKLWDCSISSASRKIANPKRIKIQEMQQLIKWSGMSIEKVQEIFLR